MWSDGAPVTGDDYRYAIEAMARARKGGDLASIVTGYLDYANGRTDQMSGVAVRDGGRVVEIALTRPLCPAVRNLNLSLLPRHLFVADWDNHTRDTSGSIERSPLAEAPPASVGPFVFKDRTPEGDVRLVRNDRYYKGAPVAAGITFKVLEGRALRTAVQADQVTMLQVTPADADGWQQITAGRMEPRIVPRPQTYTFIGWNERSSRAPWLADKRVRQALWYALNIDDMIDRVLGGYAHRVYTHTPETSWAYGAQALNHYDFDPARAKRLLEEAGATMGTDGVYRWRDGRPMRMRIETNDEPIRRSVLSTATTRYRAIGIAIDPVVESFAQLTQRMQRANPDVDGFLNGWQMWPDPDSFEWWHSSRINGFNYVAFSDPEVDRALLAGRNGPDCSTAVRRAAYATVDRILNEEAPYAFLYSSDSLLLVSKRLQGAEPKPYADHVNVERWSFVSQFR